jgi:hypothetical protein
MTAFLRSCALTDPGVTSSLVDWVELDIHNRFLLTHPVRSVDNIANRFIVQFIFSFTVAVSPDSA